MNGPRVTLPQLSTLISVEDYENSEKFLQRVCDNIRKVPGTMMLDAVHSIKLNTVWIRNTACFQRNQLK